MTDEEFQIKLENKFLHYKFDYVYWFEEIQNFDTNYIINHFSTNGYTEQFKFVMANELRKRLNKPEDKLQLLLLVGDYLL